jgi:hypothetical protein
MFSIDCPPWYKDAPCAGKDRLFFSAKPASRKLASSICSSECPNTSECLEFAVRNNLTIGVWGGKTGPELSRLVDSVDA